jgi:PAS domain S-box-containing protein
MKRANRGLIEMNIKNSVSTKLLRIVFSFYLIIAIGVTVGHMVLEFRYQKKSISNDLADMQSTFENNIAIDIWQMDQESLHSTIEGMLKIPTIAGVKIQNGKGKDLAIGGIVSQGSVTGEVGLHINLLGMGYGEAQVHKDKLYKFEVIAHTFPISYEVDNELKQLGKVTIYSNTTVIFRRVKLEFLLLFVNALLKTIALWFIFLWFSNRLLRKPLVSLATSLGEVNLENLDSFKVEVETQDRNELKILEESFNSMIGNLNHSVLERKAVEKELRESELKFRNIIQQSNDAIYIFFNYKFELINERFTELTGISFEETQDPDFVFINIIAPEDRSFIEERNRKYDRGEKIPTVYEYSLIDKDKKRNHVQASVTQIDYQGSKATLGVLRDITEQKSLEEQLRQTQKIESIGQLAGGIAHDFNNLLTPIIGNSEMAMFDMKPGDHFYEEFHEIFETAFRASELTKQLLAFSRKQLLEVITVDLNQLIKDFSGILRRTIREDIEIKAKFDLSISPVKVDISQVEQILMNLLVNAQDAMPDGGLVSMETESVELDQMYAASRPDVKPGKYVMLAISDTGQGMKEDTIQNIFDPFFTTKGVGKGTGLGLSTVYGIMKQHDGDIWVYSEPDKGTTFKLFFPEIEKEAIQNLDIVLEKESTEGVGNILVVEDEEQVRRIASRILEAKGYNVQVAESGEKAIEIINNGNGDRIDLLLTDVIMPNMNGLELFGKLAEIQPDLKVLYMSGYTQDVISHHGILEEGINFIQKPLTVESLAKKVKSVMEQ